MKIALGADHAGYGLKEEIKQHLLCAGHEVTDCGTSSGDLSVDYPDCGFRAAEAVANHKADRGILFCGTGIGMSITANKVAGIRAALCHDHFTAALSRRHNDANVLVIGSRVTGSGLAKEIVDTWLCEEFEGGRHAIRVEKIREFERKHSSEAVNAACSANTAGGRTVVIEHPLVRHKLGLMRDKNTSSKDFRELVQEVAGLMVYEITRHLSLEEIEIETPVAKARAFTLSGKKTRNSPGTQGRTRHGGRHP